MSRFTPPTPSFIYVGNQSRLPAIISPLNWEITFLCCNRTFCFPYYIALRILLRIKCKHTCLWTNGLFIVYIVCCTGPGKLHLKTGMGSFGEYIQFILFKQHCRLKVPIYFIYLHCCERAKTKKWLKWEKSKTVDRIVNIFKVEKITFSYPIIIAARHFLLAFVCFYIIHSCCMSENSPRAART